MQSTWGTVSHNGNQDAASDPVWPGHFNFDEPDSHFDEWPHPLGGQLPYQHQQDTEQHQFFQQPHQGAVASGPRQHHDGFHEQRYTEPNGEQDVAAADFDLHNVYGAPDFHFDDALGNIASPVPHTRQPAFASSEAFDLVGRDGQGFQSHQSFAQQQVPPRHVAAGPQLYGPRDGAGGSRQPQTPQQAQHPRVTQSFASQGSQQSFHAEPVYQQADYCIQHPPQQQSQQPAQQPPKQPLQQQPLKQQPQTPQHHARLPPTLQGSRQPQPSPQPRNLVHIAQPQVHIHQTLQPRHSPQPQLTRGFPQPQVAVQPKPAFQSAQHAQPVSNTLPDPRLLVQPPAAQVAQPSTCTPPLGLPVEGFGEPAAKKRKKMATSKLGVSVESTPERSDSPVNFALASKSIDDVDSFTVPVPTVEDKAMVTQFAKRKAADKARFPVVKGLPHLVTTGVVKLPTPKSYDKLTHLVAHPSRSGKPIVPELGYDLPCEVQGRFTSRYNPNLDVVGGLDQRKAEADVLLAEFDRDMAKLGRRRPKYTEYPQAFKEQLKLDDAVKTKAERKAKKEKESKPLRSAVRPEDPVEGAVWDILGAVHIESSTPRSTTLVAGAVQRVRDIFAALRGQLTRAKQNVDQVVRDGESDQAIESSKKELETHREALYRALDACIVHGDDAVLNNLGGHQKLILTLVNILISCINQGDYNGKVPKAVLELMTIFSITRKVADNANFEMVRKRFADKGDQDVKDMLKEITQKIQGSSSMVSTAGGKDSPTVSPTGKAAKTMAAVKPTAISWSMKRGREDDGDSRTVKKIAVESSNSLSKKLGPQKFVLTSASKIPAGSKAVATATAKARPITKSALEPNSTTPAAAADESETKTDARPELKAAAGIKAETAKPPSRPEASGLKAVAPRSTWSSTSALGIASLLDSINAPKPERSTSRDRKTPAQPETAKERDLRLKKEMRRSLRLRVTWKSDEELEQIRIFHKDVHEHEGRSANMTRDVADGRKEGMLLKQRQTVEEEEEEDEDDVPYRPWTTPIPTDISSIPEQARTKNYVTRGGEVGFQTDEQRSMEEREQRELMAIYPDPSDMPTTPRSPPAATSTAPEDSRTIGLPTSFGEIHQRWQDSQRVGRHAAVINASQRLDSKRGGKPGRSTQVMPSSTGPQVVLPAGPVEQQVLHLLSLDKVKNWRDVPPTPGLAMPLASTSPEVQMAAAAFVETIKLYVGKAYPPTQPPEWLTDHEKVRGWWMGYHRDMAAKAKRDGEEKARMPMEEASGQGQPHGQTPSMPLDWAAYFAQQQQQVQAYAPYVAMLQQAQAGYPSATATEAPQSQSENNKLQAILAQLGQGQGSTHFMGLDPNDPTYQQLSALRQLSQQMPGAHVEGQAGQGEMEWESDRNGRDWDSEHDDGNSRRGGTTKKVTLPPHRPVNSALIGTKSCTFWRQGKCARGESCTFRHD